MGQDLMEAEVERLRLVITSLSEALLRLAAVATNQNEVLLSIAQNKPFDLASLRSSVDGMKDVLLTLQTTDAGGNPHGK